MPRGGPRRDLEDEINSLLGDEEEDVPSPPKTPSPQSRRRKSAARASARSSRPGPAGDAADDDASSSSDDEPGDLRLRDDVGPDGRDEEGGQYIEGIYVPPPARPALTFECTGPRLVISHIESVNFKSYAGYHRLGPFHQSFTSIVGPNGSGKSNVIDSMLFVFGVRAQKIRSKKVGVLIHKSDGTAYEHCTVTVHFEEVIDKPDGDCDVVPGSQFRVSRTAFRTNESHYELNGKRSSLKEVGRFLRERKIDLDHNRFLILQGEVEQIAMMKPKALNEHDCGLLEFLEDVIGTVRYKVPLELLGKKLEEVEQERDEHMNRVKLTEKDLRQLDEPRQKALGYLRLMNELALTQNSIYQYRVRDYSEKLETLEKEKVAIEGEKSEIVQQINVFEEEKKVFDTEAKEVEKALADHTKRDDKAREKFNRVEKRDLELVAEGKRKADLRSKRKKEVKNLEAEIQTWARKPEENEREIAKLEKSLGGSDKEIETKKAELDAVMQTLDQETKRFQDEKDEYEEELSTLRKKYNEVKASMDMAQKNLDVYLSEETREKAKAVQIKTDLDNQRASLERKLEQLGELETEVREKVARRGPLQKELETLEKEELRLSHEVRRIHEQLTEKKNEFKNSAFRGRVIEGLMKEKKAGRIPGIFGRLGDLAAIDAKYDVAISTACPQLEHILVDSVDTGSECIRYLKANNLPRTSFVALDKQDKNAREMTIPKRFPENSLRLFDLIKVTDQRVLPAFYFVLRDALVVENLDLATRVAFDKSQRYKVVTINGDLIEVSGTMTGGGNQKICGKMGSKVVTRSEVGADNAEKETERVMEKLQTEGDQLRQQLNAVRDQKHQLQQEQDLLLRRLSELDRTVKMLTLDVNNLKVSVPALEARAVEQEKRLQQVVVDAGVVEQRQAEIDQRKKEFEEAKASVGVVQKKVDDLDAKMKKATSGKANTARDALKQAENKKKNIAKEISRLKVEVMTAGKKVENSKKRIEELTAEMEELAQAIEDVKATRASNEQDGKNAIAELDELKKDREELLGKKKEIDKKVAEVTNREGNVRSKLITIEQKLKEKVGEVKAIAPKVVDCKNHLAGLKLEPIDDEAMPTELPVLTEEELDALDVNGLKGEVHKLEQSLAKDKPNLAILEEYKEKQMAYIKRVDEFELVMLRRKKVREGVDLMKMRRSQEFIQGFTTISNKLKELYRIITLGGDAELELVDSMDPFSEGVHFTVRPPKKSWKNIINLSGGEKTLSSLALVFALHYYRPTPFYVMDEIDAALDFKNVSIVGRYIKERTKNAQFIIISLRSQMFELANRMVGIFKVRNVTGSLTIEPEMVFYSALALRRLPNDDRDLITARRAAVDVLRKEKIRRLENAVREKAEEEQMEREEQEEEQVDKMSRLLVTSISLCQLSPDTPAASQGEQLIKCVDEESVRYGLERDLVEAFKKALRDGLPQELWTAAMLFRKKMKMEEMDPEARLAMLRKRMRATSQGPAGLDDTNRSGFGDDSVAVARGLDAEEEEEEAGIKPLLDFVQRVIREANEEKAKAKMATATAAVNANRPGTQKGPTATAAAATDGTSKKDKAMKKVESLSKNTMMARKPVSEVAAKGTAAGVVPADEPQPSRGAKRKSATASDEDMSNGVAPARRSRSSRQIEK